MQKHEAQGKLSPAAISMAIYLKWSQIMNYADIQVLLVATFGNRIEWQS